MSNELPSFHVMKVGESEYKCYRIVYSDELNFHFVDTFNTKQQVDYYTKGSYSFNDAGDYHNGQ